MHSCICRLRLTCQRLVRATAFSVYEYVRGGFAEKEMPTAEGAKNGMYEAFDSALRASSYNMFCSPLKPVNSPAAFKAEQEASAAARSGGGFDKLEGITTLKFSGKEIDEDPEEVRLRTMQQYAELDRLIKGDQRATSGNSKLIKMQRKAGKLDKKTPNSPAPVSASTPASTKPLQTTGAVPVPSSVEKTGMSQKQKKKLQGNGVTLDLAGQLEGLKGRGESDGSGSKEKMEAYDDDDMVESSDVEEGYAELQKLLGHKASKFCNVCACAHAPIPSMYSNCGRTAAEGFRLTLLCTRRVGNKPRQILTLFLELYAKTPKDIFFRTA